ncbi:MAG: hypothetical protein R2800_14560 [Flavipsychrobacter sp.]
MLSRSAYRLGLVVLLSCITVFSACKKDDDNDTTTENTGYAEDLVLIQQSFDDLDEIVMRAQYGGTGSLKGGENPLAACATIIHDTATTPKRILIDFGNTGCISYDGRVRTGKLNVFYEGDYRTANYYHRVEPQFYTVDGNRVSGIRKITAVGRNMQNQLYYTEEVKGEVVLKNGGGTLKADSKRTLTMVAGEQTLDVTDNVYSVDGFGEMTRANGEVFTTEVVKPLNVSFSCNYINKGVIRVIPAGFTHRFVDYGDGACDNKATVTVNNVGRVVTLP